MSDLIKLPRPVMQGKIAPNGRSVIVLAPKGRLVIVLAPKGRLVIVLAP